MAEGISHHICLRIYIFFFTYDEDEYVLDHFGIYAVPHSCMYRVLSVSDSSCMFSLLVPSLTQEERQLRSQQDSMAAEYMQEIDSVRLVAALLK